jgi:hypothetical protein
MTGLVVEHPEEVGLFRFSHDLIREAVAAELSALRRARLHAQLAQALESLHGDNPSQAAELARHCLAAIPVSGAEKAVTTALRAADVATARLGHEQGEAQLHRAWELVPRLPVGPDRDRRELEVLLRLGSLLTMTKGYAATETGEAWQRAAELCRQVGADPELVPVLWRLVAFHTLGGRLDSGQVVAQELPAFAESSRQPADLIAAHNAVGFNAIHRGDLVVAQHHLEHALALSEEMDDPWLGSWFPQHPRVSCSAFQAWKVWLLGDREVAWGLVHDALEMTNRLGDDFTTAHALHFAAWLAAMDHDAPTTRRWAKASLAFATDKGFPFYAAMSVAFLGWASAVEDQSEAGADQIRESIAGLRASGVPALLTFFLALLAEAQQLTGRRREARATVDEAL